MLVCDVVLCAREKDVQEVELEQWWRGALENSGTKVSIEKTEYTCLNGMPTGSVNMLPQVTELRCLGGTYPVANGDINI